MRDKFLTEALGECWHTNSADWEFRAPWPYRCLCGYGTDYKVELDQHCCDSQPDFSTWEGFGKLWEWAQKQDWWCEFFVYHVQNPKRDTEDETALHTWTKNINPTRFANVVYEFLQRRGTE